MKTHQVSHSYILFLQVRNTHWRKNKKLFGVVRHMDHHLAIQTYRLQIRPALIRKVVVIFQFAMAMETIKWMKKLLDCSVGPRSVTLKSKNGKCTNWFSIDYLHIFYHYHYLWSPPSKMNLIAFFSWFFLKVSEINNWNGQLNW